MSDVIANSKEEEMMEALRQVIDPEIGLNIVELGLIRNMELSDDHAKLTMIMTTPFCPYGPQIVAETRKVACTVIPNTIVEIGTELWDPSMMEEGAGGDWGLF